MTAELSTAGTVTIGSRHSLALPRLAPRGFGYSALFPVLAARHLAKHDDTLIGSPNADTAAHCLVRAAAALIKHSGNPSMRKPIRLARQIMLGRIVDAASREVRSDALIIAAASAALRGAPVHVVAASAKSAARLAEQAGPVLGLLGLSASALADDADFDERRKAYGGAVVFASVMRLAQDAIRDEVGLAGRMMGLRGSVSRLGARRTSLPALMPEHRVAFIDDADLVLLEALRPVRFAEDSEQVSGRIHADQAYAILSELERDVHYTIDPATGRIRLSEQGNARIETFVMLFGGAWSDTAWRERTILAALTTRDLFMPEVDYEVSKGEVVMKRAVGAVGESPSIRDLVAAKEGLPGGVGAAHFWGKRQLFKSYALMGGVGLDLGECRDEFRKAYGQRVVAGRPPKLPPGPRLFASRHDLLAALAEEPVPDRGALLWAPTPLDAQDLPDSWKACPLKIGDGFVDLLGEASLVVQLGAARLNWELRLHQNLDGARILALVSPEDGLFQLLEPGDEMLKILSRRMSANAYRKAQGACAVAARSQRLAQLRSEEYFERVLSFVGAPS